MGPTSLYGDRQPISQGQLIGTTFEEYLDLARRRACTDCCDYLFSEVTKESDTYPRVEWPGPGKDVDEGLRRPKSLEAASGGPLKTGCCDARAGVRSDAEVRHVRGPHPVPQSSL